LRIKKHKETGDSWLIVSSLAIFFFLYQWLVLFSTTGIQQCETLSSFWLPEADGRFSLFGIIALIFGLFFLLSFTDAVRALSLNNNDKWVSVTIFFAVTVCSIFTARTLYAQWENLQIEKGYLTALESRYLYIEVQPAIELIGESNQVSSFRNVLCEGFE